MTRFNCTNKCKEYNARKYYGKWDPKTESKCTECEVTILYKGIFCPCCNCRLRHTNTNKARANLINKRY